MSRSRERQRICPICGQSKALSRFVPGELVRPAIVELIENEHPSWSHSDYICTDDLNQYRIRFIESLLETEKGELSSLDHDVVESLKREELVSGNVNTEYDRALTFGERLADRIADFGGSWTFIVAFAFVLFGWMALNSWLLVSRPFDPYPYILLNLVLSSLAAIQAPVIMMSQNRQEDRDRLRAEYDYRINLKAELEIRHLHEKIDHLLSRQWERLVEIQKVQIDLMNELERGTGKER